MPELKSILLVEDDSCDAELIITSLTERNPADKVVVMALITKTLVSGCTRNS
jgi:hypothetical protein